MNPACTEGLLNCTLALYEPIMKAVQASTNAVPQENTAWMYVRVHTCSDHVYIMYILCTYMACTISLCHEQKIQKGNIMKSSSFEPRIVCKTASCLNHYASSMLVSYTIVTVYVYCFSTWLGKLVTNLTTVVSISEPGCSKFR